MYGVRVYYRELPKYLSFLLGNAIHFVQSHIQITLYLYEIIWQLQHLHLLTRILCKITIYLLTTSS